MWSIVDTVDMLIIAVLMHSNEIDFLISLSEIKEMSSLSKKLNYSKKLLFHDTMIIPTNVMWLRGSLLLTT